MVYCEPTSIRRNHPALSYPLLGVDNLDPTEIREEFMLFLKDEWVICVFAKESNNFSNFFEHL